MRAGFTGWPDRTYWSACPWLPFFGFQLRKSAYRFRLRAIRGRMSANRTPGTAVLTTPYSPRTACGASGFGSNVSWWLVPPRVQIRMQLTSVRDSFAIARRASRPGRVRPRPPSRPALSRSRRWTPSQSRNVARRSESMALGGGGDGGVGGGRGPRGGPPGGGPGGGPPPGGGRGAGGGGGGRRGGGGGGGGGGRPA